MGTRALTFGVSGMLWRNALIMFDRETDTLWSHLTGVAVRGRLATPKRRLTALAAVPRVRWDAWRAEHPTTKVLVVDGRTRRPLDVYADYHRSPRTGVVPVEHTDRRLAPKALVIGCRLPDGAALAVPHAAFPKAASCVGAKGAWIAFRDPANHATAVWAARTAKGPVTFAPGKTAGRFLANRGTPRSRWDCRRGVAVDGPRRGERLQPIPHLNVYWFAWADFYPKTRLAVVPPRARPTPGDDPPADPGKRGGR